MGEEQLSGKDGIQGRQERERNPGFSSSLISATIPVHPLVKNFQIPLVKEA